MRLVCQPIVHKDSYNGQVEREVLEHLRETIYQPIFDTLAVNGLAARTNSAERPAHTRGSAVSEAIAAGALWYAAGVFTGQLDAAISRELRSLGAVLSGGQFVLPADKLPFALRQIIAQSAARSELIHREIVQLLSQIEENLAKAPVGLDFTNAVDTVTKDLQKQFIGTVPASEEVPSPPALPPDLSSQLQEKLTRTADLSIKDFSLKQAAELRARVQLNQSAGGRTDRLVKIVEADYGIAKRKAAFIAENETSNLVAQFREDRFKAVGSNRYVWLTSEDEKVRPDHAALANREFSWDAPPICDRATGRRCHPGQDYNCRCAPLAVLNVAA